MKNKPNNKQTLEAMINAYETQEPFSKEDSLITRENILNLDTKLKVALFKHIITKYYDSPTSSEITKYFSNFLKLLNDDDLKTFHKIYKSEGIKRGKLLGDESKQMASDRITASLNELLSGEPRNRRQIIEELNKGQAQQAEGDNIDKSHTRRVNFNTNIEVGDVGLSANGTTKQTYLIQDGLRRDASELREDKDFIRSRKLGYSRRDEAKKRYYDSKQYQSTVKTLSDSATFESMMPEATREKHMNKSISIISAKLGKDNKINITFRVENPNEFALIRALKRLFNLDRIKADPISNEEFLRRFSEVNFIHPQLQEIKSNIAVGLEANHKPRKIILKTKQKSKEKASTKFRDKEKSRKNNLQGINLQ
ncbi:MAG: hypothetical protein K0Q51_40 [Rickettsiaceae bacterium]|jgi:hypothetical protein|nr:hypothetical protein [Rickettsiaceae bacterium]